MKCKERKSIEFFTGSPTKSGIYKICKTCRCRQRDISKKICSLCKETKSVDNFVKSVSNKDGYGNQCKSCQSEYFYEYHRKNSERKRQYDKNRYKSKKEEISKRGKEYYKKNKEIVKQRQREWGKNNPDKVRKQSSEKRSKKKNSIPPWLTNKQKHEIYLMHVLAKALERETGIKYHVDHIIPLTNKNLCGLHVPWNLRVIPEKDNMRKNNQFIPELGLTAC